MIIVSAKSLMPIVDTMLVRYEKWVRNEALTVITSATPAHATSSRNSSENLDRALLASVSAGDRRAIEKLYERYFSRLAKFLFELNVHANFVEDLIIDTMVDLWKERASIGVKVPVSVEIMRLAYSNRRRHFAKLTEAENARALLYLVYGCGHSRRDIADIMKVSGACVDRLLSAARGRQLP